MRKALDAARRGTSDPVRAILVHRDEPSPAAGEVAALAASEGVPVHTSAPEELWRLSAGSPAADILAVTGPDPAAPFRSVSAGRGAIWLLCGVAFPGNAGFAIRTAEVSGAAAIVLANDFGPRSRRKALRAGMGANRFFPVFWQTVEETLAIAGETDRRVVAVEDVGDAAPWDTDLTGRCLFAIGGEHDGLPDAVLDAADSVVRVPMHGFIPSHNLQAALAIVLGERERQEWASGAAQVQTDS